MTKSLRASPLGGVGRFGRNALLLEAFDGEIREGAVVVDFGVRFLGAEGFGFDVGLPDLNPIAALGSDLDGVLVTHGHEDHIGALPFLHAENPAPIFATPFTCALIERRFRRYDRAAPVVHEVELGTTHTVGPFQVRWRAVSHSIPDASCLVIDTPVGRVVHSGDFRIDPAPLLGEPTDIDGLTVDGDEGVAILFADSTGAGTPGDNPGEASVIPALTSAFEAASGRVFVATFGSQLSRLVAVAHACRATGRKLALAGRSLEDTVAIARRLGEHPLDDVLINRAEAWGRHPHHVVIACTGAQGERNAALARLATGQNTRVPMSKGDTVLWSARVIPGNEITVARVVDDLTERGVEVVFDRALHVSGHGNAGDLETLLAATRPKAFVAVHGNVHHLARHRSILTRSGLDPNAVVALTDGQAVTLDATGTVGQVVSGARLEPFAIGSHVDHAPAGIVSARRLMAQGGVVVAHVDREQKRIAFVTEAVSNPPAPKKLQQIARRAARAFLSGAHPEEVHEGESVDDAMKRFISARFEESGGGRPYVALVNDGALAFESDAPASDA